MQEPCELQTDEELLMIPKHLVTVQSFPNQEFEHEQVSGPIHVPFPLQMKNQSRWFNYGEKNKEIIKNFVTNLQTFA